MVLLLAIAAGLLAGLIWARWRGQPYQSPALHSLWLAFIAFLPQFLLVYLPLPHKDYADPFVALCILVSQILFLGFAWINRWLPGMIILILGLVLNMAVMSANSGFMPISPQVAGRLVSQENLMNIPMGSRFGTKDILLLPQNTRFEWLADRFLPPSWSPYQVAFSLGDVFVAIGAFWLLAKQSSLQA
jgi:hypothetical protein